jgi:hypothetical protein
MASPQGVVLSQLVRKISGEHPRPGDPVLVAGKGAQTLADAAPACNTS